MSPIKSLVRKRQMEIKRKEKIKLRKHLNADALFDSVRTGFGNIVDHDQLISCRAFIQLHGVELIGKGLKVFDGIGALLTECFQAQVKGHEAAPDRIPWSLSTI